MPTYEYHCPANGQTVTLFHGMNVRLQTWDEVCKSALIALGETPHDAPVIRLIGSGLVFIKRPEQFIKSPSGGCCGTNGCND